MSRQEYDETKRLLQIELLKLQAWIDETGKKVCVVFEGRDAAGKGGTIKRFMEHLNPRGARSLRLGFPPRESRVSGTSNAGSPICPTAGESCCSTGRGTPAPSSIVSWATAPRSNTSNSCAMSPSSNVHCRRPT